MTDDDTVTAADLLEAQQRWAESTAEGAVKELFSRPVYGPGFRGDIPIGHTEESQLLAREAALIEAYNENDHPRGKDGRYIDKGDMQAAAADPAKAKKLLAKLDPDNKAKLRKYLASTPKQQAALHAHGEKHGVYAAPTGSSLPKTPASSAEYAKASGQQPPEGARHPLPKVSDKGSEIANKSHLTDRTVQRWAEEHNETLLARAVGGNQLADNQPVDVIVSVDPNVPVVMDVDGNITSGAVAAPLELKTLVHSKSGKIRMKLSAKVRKAELQVHCGKPIHTIAFDDRGVFNANGKGKHDESKRLLYYKRGGGTFAAAAQMLPVKDFDELKKLIEMPDTDLPLLGRPTVNWTRLVQRVTRNLKRRKVV